MKRSKFGSIALLATCLAGILAVTGCGPAGAEGQIGRLPDPTQDIHPSTPNMPQTVAFAGGCFWGIQGVFEHINGVISATSGYAGGTTVNPTYEEVSSGRTGHAETVKVVFDPSKVSYGQLLQIFFSVALDPTEVNRQGPDTGTQYRSIVFFNSPSQERVARAYIGQLEGAKIFSRPIATQILPLSAFYPAEAYHQDYMKHHPESPYIFINDLPKVAHLKSQFPHDYRND